MNEQTQRMSAIYSALSNLLAQAASEVEGGVLIPSEETLKRFGTLNQLIREDEKKRLISCIMDHIDDMDK